MARGGATISPVVLEPGVVLPYRRRSICRLFPVAFVVVVGAAWVFERPAGAASVPYVGSVPVTDAGGGTTPHLSGGVVAERTVPFLLIDGGFDQAYDLTLHNFVVREPSAGTLDFYYQVTNRSARPLRLIDMDTGRFSRPGSVDPIDVNLWDETTGTFAPLLADRTASNFDGVALQFPSLDFLAPGESSRLFFIRTGATDFELGGLTQFRSTPGTTSDNGFAVTFNPVLDGPIIPPPVAAPTPGPPTPGPSSPPVASVPLPAGWYGAAGVAAVILLRRPRLVRA